MNHWHNQKLDSESLTFEAADQNYLGPNLELVDCRIVLRTTARALTISANVRFVGCQIEARRRLANFQMWCGAVIEDCTFTGAFSGNDFGHWEAQAPGGSIGHCDFSGATLNSCRFMDCDPATIKLPNWPCFTIVQPRRRARDFANVQWPGKLGVWANTLSEELSLTSAYVEHAPTLARQFGATQEELRQALERLDNVVF